MVAAKAPPVLTVATKGGRGTSYSWTEDLLIAKAFVAALEDPIHGNAMKGTAFMSKMHAAYKILLVEQEKLEHQSRRFIRIVHRLLIKKIPNEIYLGTNLLTF